MRPIYYRGEVDERCKQKWKRKLWDADTSGWRELLIFFSKDFCSSRAIFRMEGTTAGVEAASALQVETGKPWAAACKDLQGGVGQRGAVLHSQGLEERAVEGNFSYHCSCIISCCYAQD